MSFFLRNSKCRLQCLTFPDLLIQKKSYRLHIIRLKQKSGDLPGTAPQEICVLFFCLSGKPVRLPKSGQRNPDQSANILSCFCLYKKGIVLLIIYLLMIDTLPLVSAGSVVVRLHDPGRRILHRLFVVLRKDQTGCLDLFLILIGDMDRKFKPLFLQNLSQTGLARLSAADFHMA